MLGRSSSVDHQNALRLLASELQESAAHPPMESDPLPLESSLVRFIDATGRPFLSGGVER